MKAFLCIIVTLLSLSTITAYSKDKWIERSIYQVLTDRIATSDGSSPGCSLGQYCGGTWKGLEGKLDYIAGMGFDAIWISPIVKNTDGSYHGYHLTDLDSLNEKYGTKAELQSLIAKAHEKGIWMMLDVVANHVGPVGEDFSRITYFNKAEHYHDTCQITDWNNQDMVENCRLSDLPDLKQENSYVADKLKSWVKNIVTEYNFDGIRIDTIPEVPKWFWKEFAASANTFQLGEVFNGNVDYVSDYQNYVDSVFNYPLYYAIENSFCNSMRNIENYWWNTRPKFPQPKYLGVFVENHDNPRFLNRCNNQKKFKNANIFSIMWEGIPVFYYGGEQWFSGGADPNNREPLWGHYDTNSEMYQALKIANKVRKEQKIWNYDLVQRYADDVFYAFTRGDNVLVCVTRGESCTRSITYHNWSDGTKLCNAFDSNDCVTVSGGAANINMGTDPKIYVKQ